MANDLAVILPWVGPLPSYFDWFYQSCLRNGGVDFYVFTDQLFVSTAANVTVMPTSLPVLAERLSAALGFPASLTSPYKLCDFKPAILELLSKDLAGTYSHVAMCDCDLVFGDILGVLPPDWRRYDALSFRPWWVSGAFFILRNSDPALSFYKLSDFYETCYRDPKHYSLLECFKQYGEARSNDLDFYRTAQDSFSRVLKLKVRYRPIYFGDLIRESIAPGETVIVDRTGVRYTGGGGADARYLCYHMISDKGRRDFRMRGGSLPLPYAVDRFGPYPLRGEGTRRGGLLERLQRSGTGRANTARNVLQRVKKRWGIA